MKREPVHVMQICMIYHRNYIQISLGVEDKFQPSEPEQRIIVLFENPSLSDRD